MLFSKSRLAAFGTAAMVALGLSGCYLSKTRIIEDGDQVSWGDHAYCTVNNKKVAVDLSTPRKNDKGGIFYRTATDHYTFKRIEDDLYLVQLENRGLFRFMYLLTQGTTAKLLTFPAQSNQNIVRAAQQANITFGSDVDGWTELIGRRADVERFLMSAKIGYLSGAGEHSFEKPADFDGPILGKLRKNMTRDQVLKLQGAEECRSEEVCFSDLRMTGLPPQVLEGSTGKITVAFNDTGIGGIDIEAQNLNLRADNRPLGGVKGFLPVEVGGGNTTPLYLGLNDEGLLFTLPKDQQEMHAKSVLRLMALFQSVPTVSQFYGMPELKNSRIVLTNNAGIQSLAGSTDTDAAVRKLKRSGHPLLDFATSKNDNGLVNWNVVVVP